MHVLTRRPKDLFGSEQVSLLCQPMSPPGRDAPGRFNREQLHVQAGSRPMTSDPERKAVQVEAGHRLPVAEPGHSWPSPGTEGDRPD